MRTTSSNEPVQATPRWAVILGVSSGSGAAIARAVARDPGMHIFGVHRGHHEQMARALEEELRALGVQVVMRVADAGTAEGAAAGAAAFRDVAGPRSVGLFVHSIAAASLGHFLSTRHDAFHPRQFEKTFNYMAHSFAYWAQQLHEGDLLAAGARLLGLTNMFHESLLHNCGLISASKAALQMYVRHLALELGPLGHRVNLLKFPTVMTPALEKMLGSNAMRHVQAAHRDMIPAGRMCTVEEVGSFVSLLLRDEASWLNGATIDFTGGMTLRLLDLILKPD
jgi:NAD(P)-dependent dehydrogenase (short-subunit alcohol dehydrogenase family)